MCYLDDGDYFEPSEFDEKIEELKNELRESVKKEINDEIEKLQSEQEGVLPKRECAIRIKREK